MELSNSRRDQYRRRSLTTRTLGLAQSSRPEMSGFEQAARPRHVGT